MSAPSRTTTNAVSVIVAHGPLDLRVGPHGVNEEGTGVGVELAYGGICGSDLSYFRNGKVGDFAISEPLILGHEVVGTITDVPEELDGLEGLAVGARVAVHPARYPLPPKFRADRPNLSSGVRYLGSAALTPHTQGGFRSYAQFLPEQLYVLPDTLPSRTAVLAEPLAVALHAVARAGTITGKTVCIIGAGPIGLLCIAAAHRAGVASVTVADIREGPLKRASAIGADETRLVGDSIDERTFDVVIEASGAPMATSQAIRAARSGGKVVQVGLLPGGMHNYDLAQLVTREVDLLGSFRFDGEFSEAIDLLDEAAPSISSVITHEFPAFAAKQAFEVALDANVSSKVIVDLQAWVESDQQ